VFVITALVFVGISESKRASNIMVAIKLSVVFLVIVLGSFYVQAGQLEPLCTQRARRRTQGSLRGLFCLHWFDAISTTAEECKNPQRDLPRGMIYSLIICTVLYVLIALILTGMVNYKSLAVGDPLAFVFGPEGANIPWVSGNYRDQRGDRRWPRCCWCFNLDSRGSGWR
jgi:amino acid transporter